MGINPLTGLEEDQFLGPTPGQMPASVQLDPTSISAEYDARKKALDDQNSQYDTTGAIQGALASLGAAFQGGNSLNAVNNVMAQRDAQRKEKSAALENWINNKRQQIAMNAEASKQKREDSKYAMDEAQRKREDDPNSIESKAAQQAAMSMGIIKPEDLPKLTATIFKNQGPMYEKQYQAKLNAQSRGDAMKERNMQFQERMHDKTSSETDKLAKDFKNDLDADKGRSGNFGLISGKVQSAERLQTLIDAYKDGNLPPAQMEELALGLSNMLAPGGGGSRAQVEALVPHSITGDIQKFKSYLGNAPLGADQQKFVKMMGDTVQREKQTAENQLNNIRASRLSAHKRYQTVDPAGYESQLRSYHMDPANIKDGQYIAPPSDEDKEAIQWAMQNPTDPKSAMILQKNGVQVGGK